MSADSEDGVSQIGQPSPLEADELDAWSHAFEAWKGRCRPKRVRCARKEVTPAHRRDETRSQSEDSPRRVLRQMNSEDFFVILRTAVVACSHRSQTWPLPLPAKCFCRGEPTPSGARGSEFGITGCPFAIG